MNVSIWSPITGWRSLEGPWLTLSCAGFPSMREEGARASSCLLGQAVSSQRPAVSPLAGAGADAAPSHGSTVSKCHPGFTGMASGNAVACARDRHLACSHLSEAVGLPLWPWEISPLSLARRFTS